MANPIWPVDLPRATLLSEYSEDEDLGIVETDMDSGPKKRRRKQSQSERTITCGMWLSRTQLASWKNFYRNSLAGMTKEFDDFWHPGEEALIDNVTLVSQSVKPKSANVWIVTFSVRYFA